MAAGVVRESFIVAVHQLIRHQQIHGSLQEVWRFFSNPANLQALTPEYMAFTVTSEKTDKEIYPGQIITYTVSPLLHIPLFWMTEIRQVIPMKMFIDEQRRGPYRMWHHQHRFEEKNGGVWMEDHVHYELPFWLLGEMANKIFVHRQLNEIFEFRRKKVDELFK